MTQRSATGGGRLLVEHRDPIGFQLAGHVAPCEARHEAGAACKKPGTDRDPSAGPAGGGWC